MNAEHSQTWAHVALITVTLASGCSSAETDVSATPHRLTPGTQFVDERSGIAFEIPEGHALVRVELAGGAEVFGEFNFPVLEVVTSESAYGWTRSGRLDRSAAGMVATVALATNEFLDHLEERAPSSTKHERQCGSHLVTVIDESVNDEVNRTYILPLPYGYGIIVSCEDESEAEGSVVHRLLRSVQS